MSNSHLNFKRKLSGSMILMSLTLSIATSCFGSGIRKIEHPDGRIEYTNIPAGEAQQRQATRPQGETLYRYRNNEGVLVFTDQKPFQVHNVETLRFDCYACQMQTSINWHTTPLNLTAYSDTIKQAAAEYKIPTAYIRAIMHAESHFQPNARSSQGAVGLMQLMPETASDLGVNNRLDPQQNIMGGTRYLAALLQRYSNNFKLAAAAYNAGPGAVARYSGIPPYAETQTYVERVSILADRYAKQQ